MCYEIYFSVVQSIISLMSSLVVKILAVLGSTVSYSQLFCCKGYSYFFFNKNISVFAIFYHQNFNGTLTNDIVLFKQLGPGLKMIVFGMLYVIFLNIDCKYS